MVAIEQYGDRKISKTDIEMLRTSVNVLGGTSEIDVVREYGLSSAKTAGENRTILDTAITAAKAQDKGIFIDGDATYQVDNSVLPLMFQAAVVRIRLASKETIIQFTNIGQHGLQVGPGVSGGNDLGSGGYIQGGRWRRPDGVPSKDHKATILLDGWQFGEVRSTYVENGDVGYDLINNCYGTSFHQANARYNTCNLGLRLRTGIQNGCDLTFYDCWLGGRTAAVWMESDGNDGTGGYYFYGGQLTSNIVGDSTDYNDRGALTIGKNYETGVTGGEVRHVAFYGMAFEAVGRRWCVMLHSPSSVAFHNVGFVFRGSGGTGGDSTLGILRSALPYNDYIEFDGCEVSDIYRSKLIDYTPDPNSNPVLIEKGSTGQPIYYPAGAGSGVGHSLFSQGIFERSGLNKGIVLQGGQSAKLMLDGMRLRRNGSEFEKSSDGVNWTTLGGSAAVAPVIYRGKNDLMPVASHTSNYTDRRTPANFTAGATYVSYVNAHEVMVDCSTIVLVYGGWYANGNTGEIAVGNTFTIKVGIERADGTILPVTFGGKDSILIDSLSPRVCSDPVTLDQDAGTLFYTRHQVTPTGGASAYFPTNLVSRIATTGGGGFQELKQGWSTSVDLSRVTTAGTTGNNVTFGPRQIIGICKDAQTRRIWALGGDSITAGSAHDASGSGAWENACIQERVPFVKLAQGNQAAVDFNAFTRRQYRMLEVGLSGCTDGFLSWGTNDLAGGRTAAQLGADLITAAWTYRRAGLLRVYLTTVLPRTDAANTTPITGFAVGGQREQHNTWVRAGCPIDPTTKLRVAVGTSGALLAGTAGHPITGYVELADTVESARNSGLWKASMQSDGVHPNTAAHLLMQAPLRPVVAAA